MSGSFHTDSDTRAGTIGGTALVVLLNVFAHDVLRTIGLAALGATASFFVSFGWKHFLRFLQTRWRKKSNTQGKK